MGTYSASLHIQSKCGEKNSHQKKSSEQNVASLVTSEHCDVRTLLRAINEQGKKIANKKNILDRIQVNSKEECFITLKDHKPNFENNVAARLINPAKNEIGRISKVILENINKNYEVNYSYNSGIIQQQSSTGLRKLKTKTNINL